MKEKQQLNKVIKIYIDIYLYMSSCKIFKFKEE